LNGFKNRIRAAYGPAGAAWLDALPALLDECAQRWSLVLGEPFDLSYNYVAAATQHGAPVVLKAGVPHPELRSEIAAMQIFAGRGAARVLDADPEHGLLLLERVFPGDVLATICPEHDDVATRIAADVMLRVWRTLSPEQAAHFPSLERWTRGIDELAASAHPAFAPDLVQHAVALRRQLLDSAPDAVLLHGDLHHLNILRAERDDSGWLLIDPKGVIGERAYDCGPFLMNPTGWMRRSSDPRAQLNRRIALLSDALALDPARVRGWAFVHCVLSAWWSAAEEGGGGGAADLEVASYLRNEGNVPGF
jgi:streptomycin 6-kinase